MNCDSRVPWPIKEKVQKVEAAPIPRKAAAVHSTLTSLQCPPFSFQFSVVSGAL